MRTEIKGRISFLVSKSSSSSVGWHSATAASGLHETPRLKTVLIFVSVPFGPNTEFFCAGDFEVTNNDTVGCGSDPTIDLGAQSLQLGVRLKRNGIAGEVREPSGAQAFPQL